MVALAPLIPLAALVSGCGTGEPKLADAPEFKAAPDTAPPSIPGRKTAAPYGASKKYQDAMNR